MGCGSCSTGGCAGLPKGCNNNGGCSTGGCNKLNTYDWFGHMTPPDKTESESVYEVRFKNTRKAFFRNVNGLSLMTGDFIAVESDRGFDVGQISLGGILARLQMRKRKVRDNSDRVKKIYRRATADDLEKLRKARSREQETLVRTRQIILDLKLDMKLSDVEFQGDNTKAIFYYIADQRVDFRQLIKVLATEFRIRVEMKQIGLRHESGLVGGIGSCGRELCCSTWLTDFRSVSTSAARYQNLSLNPMKISGQCGRLKCCLNFELEVYMDALKDIPQVNRIDTELGVAYLQKTDIFKRIMWFSYENETSWISIDVDRVMEIIEMNKQGKKPATIQTVAEERKQVREVPLDFVDVVGQSVLREEPRKKRGGKGRGKGRGKGSNRQRNAGQQDQPANKDSNADSKQQSNKPSNRNKNRNKPSNDGGRGQGGGQNQNRRRGSGGGRNRRKGGGDGGGGDQGGGKDGGQ